MIAPNSQRASLGHPEEPARGVTLGLASPGRKSPRKRLEVTADALSIDRGVVYLNDEVKYHVNELAPDRPSENLKARLPKS